MAWFPLRVVWRVPYVLLSGFLWVWDPDIDHWLAHDALQYHDQQPDVLLGVRVAAAGCWCVWGGFAAQNAVLVQQYRVLSL